MYKSVVTTCSEILSKANDLSLHMRLTASFRLVTVAVNSVKCVELKINMLNQMFSSDVVS